MKRKSTSVLCLVAVLSGCAAHGRLSEANLQALALCNAGYSQTLSADIKGKVAEDLRDGQISADLSSEIRGLFLNDPNLPAADRLEAYNAYLGCLNSIRG